MLKTLIFTMIIVLLPIFFYLINTVDAALPVTVKIIDGIPRIYNSTVQAWSDEVITPSHTIQTMK